MAIMPLCSFLLNGQNKIINTNQLKELLNSYQGNALVLENYDIQPYLDPQKGYYDNEVTVENPVSFFIEFYNCKGDVKIIFDNVEKNAGLSFQKTKELSLIINESSSSTIIIDNSEFKEFRIAGCKSFTGNLNVKDSKFKDFSVTESNFKNLPEDKFLLNFYNSEIQNMILYKSTFNSGSINLNGSQVENITVVQCSLFRTNFSATNFLKTVAFKQSSIEKQMGLQDISLPPNTNFSFENIKGFKVAILTTSGDSVQYQYSGVSNDELADFYLFNDLLAIYNELYQLYKIRGDLESANAAYVEMKEVQTRHLKFLYEKRPGLKEFLSWKLNVFLKFFCDYGTNPVKSIILSIYTISIFALFYFLFPSETDNLKKGRLFSKIRILNSYFQSGEKLQEKANEKHKSEIKQLENFKAQLESTRVNAPSIFSFITKPFYNSSILYYKLSLWLLNKFTFIGTKPWPQLKPFQKFVTGMMLSFGFLIFVLWGVVMRLVNAALLSLNSFITLGYGEIEAKGISRYLAVVEGAVGWFLLSIFSVSLISQILQ